VDHTCQRTPVEVAVDAPFDPDLQALPCTPWLNTLSLDDPRLRPPPIANIVVDKVAAKPKRHKTWPWIFAGALGVTAVVIGVTVGVLASDPKYTVKVDGRTFGAP
jgi:hypothetical protein